MGEPPCSELSIKRAQVVAIAQAIIDGRLGLIAGARELASLRLDVDPAEDDEELLRLAGIESATEHDTQLQSSARRMCRAVVARYGQPT